MRKYSKYYERLRGFSLGRSLGSSLSQADEKIIQLYETHGVDVAKEFIADHRRGDVLDWVIIYRRKTPKVTYDDDKHSSNEVVWSWANDSVGTFSVLGMVEYFKTVLCDYLKERRQVKDG